MVKETLERIKRVEEGSAAIIRQAREEASRIIKESKRRAALLLEEAKAEAAREATKRLEDSRRDAASKGKAILDEAFVQSRQIQETAKERLDRAVALIVAKVKERWL